MNTLLYGLICFLIYLNFKQRKDLAKKAASLSEAEREISRISIENREIPRLQAENSDLSKYRPITDAKAFAEEIVSKAQIESEGLTNDAKQILSEAKNRADRIISDAQLEAKHVAGDAQDLLEKVSAMEKTSKALKNIIEGYGDQYILPTNSLLDHLAEDYSHTQAGEELKQARNRTRTLIRDENAAACDYVEDNRKQTAIKFVLDAFNGKVDTILALVKEDNFGTLEQKIKDSFATVNYNGAAFRNARITQEYLDARRAELKWACIVQAIKEKEREEQRRIREQIREEEKAAKEYERAIKEAQKEEESIARAMEKVKEDIESANEQQRLKYEEKLKDLQLKLTEAEDKNKRALSLAQQTKTGHVYIISNIGSFGEEVLKIGMTRRLDPMDRVYELGDASVPFEFDVHAMILSEDAPNLEKELHRIFSDSQVNKVNPRKEFFKLPISEIKKAVEKMGITAHWTMTAEAREYRESLALFESKKKRAA